MIYVTGETENEMLFWIENLVPLNEKGNSFCHLTERNIIDIKMYSDASGEGYGGYLANEKDELIDNSEMFGNWVSHEMKQSSTWREFEAVNRVLHQNLNYIQGKTVQIVSDNKNVSRILQIGSKKNCLNDIGLEIMDVCNKYEVRVIPRSRNIHADRLSRCFDCDDWGIQWWLYLS
jgi:hypothetical protein